MFRFIPLAVLIALAPVCEPAFAGNIGRAAPPPLVLSPNLTEPWILQLRPQGQRQMQRRQAQPPRTRNWLFGGHPQTASVASNLGGLLKDMKRPREAEPLFRRASRSLQF